MINFSFSALWTLQEAPEHRKALLIKFRNVQKIFKGNSNFYSCPPPKLQAPLGRQIMNLTLYIPPVWKKTKIKWLQMTMCLVENETFTRAQSYKYENETFTWSQSYKYFAKNKFIIKKIIGNRIEVKYQALYIHKL